MVRCPFKRPRHPARPVTDTREGGRSVGAAEQVLEFIVLDLAGAVLINVLDQFLDVDRHFELVLDDSDELFSVDVAFFVGEASHGDVRIDGVFVIRNALVLLLFRNYMLELGVGDLSGVFSVSFRDHSEDLLLGGLLAHHLEHNAELVRVDLA